MTTGKATRLEANRREVIAGGMAAATAIMLPAGIAGAETPAAARNRTLILIGINSRDGRWVDYELWNPYAIGANHQNGPNLIYEPLAYYSAFADKWYMWLAESYDFTPDFKQLTIKTRPGINWSDGTPFGAEDVAYTMNTLRDLGPKVKWGIDVNQALNVAKVIDPNTVVLDFKIPSPRFFFFATYKYDIGIYIVPKHIFQGQDWTTFKHFDTAKGWPVTTGPWQVVESSLQQKVFERRANWWAAEQKLASMPQVERNIWLPTVNEQNTAQAQITNHSDFGGPLQPATFPTVIRQNPKVTSYSGQKPPWGYVDWWPISLYVNNEVKPFDDKDVRWALSHYIDRKQLIDIAYLGADTVSSLPMPPYKPLLPYFDAVKDLLEKYDTLEFNPKKATLCWPRRVSRRTVSCGRRPTASRLPSPLSALALPDPLWARCCRKSCGVTGWRRTWRYRPTSMTVFKKANMSARSMATAAVSASRTTPCASTKAKASPCPVRMQ